MTAPIIQHRDTVMQGPAQPEREGQMPNPDCCPECWGYTFHRNGCSKNDGLPRLAKPVGSLYRRPSANTIICTLVIIACVAAATLLWVDAARAREGAIHPIPAPSALLKARAACPNTASLVECRGALRRAYDAVNWQRHARWHAQASTSRDVVVDAIHWAAQKTGVAAWRMIGIGTCESHLFWLAENGQYKSWAQLSTRHRADPIIARLTWRDPYAVALHVARYIRDHGESEWQCQSTGGLRW